MKKRIFAVFMSAVALTSAVFSTPVLADGQKVVTLGADLTEEQKQMMLRYFGVAGQNLQTLTITNQDERDHLGSYVPLEQIGTRTYSCALVSPTTSGGIQVKTANLSWVTSNMIAATLSTSGVVNCDVLAAAPFEVSGTGALTGIIMAYESAVGETLDSAKKEVATQELITTANIADSIGQVQATEIVNESKMQIIQGNVVNQNEIDVIINEVAAEENISLTDEDRELLSQLLQEIAQQDYNYEEMKDTLERVEQNMQELADSEEIEENSNVETWEESEASILDDALFIDGDTDLPDESEIPGRIAEDSILNNTDDSALGEYVIFDATDESVLSDQTSVQDETTASGETVAPDGNLIPADSVITEEDLYAEEDWNDGIDAETPADDIDMETPAGDVYTETPAGDVYAEIPTEDIYTETSAEGIDTEDLSAGDSYTEENNTAAETWIEDTGTEDNLTDENDGITTLQLEVLPLSEFVFAPMTSDATGYEVFAPGGNELTIYFQRDDIIAGSGTLSLFDASDSSLVETVTMSDESRVVIEPLEAAELDELGWTAGNKAVIHLINPLEQSMNYFAALSEDALCTADGIGRSEATPDSYTWMFVTSEYGFGLNTSAAGVTAGVAVTGNLMMDTTAAVYAAIENADPSLVSFDVSEFTESGSFTAVFVQAGVVTFQVSFYDETGSLLKTLPYEVTVK